MKGIDDSTIVKVSGTIMLADKLKLVRFENKWSQEEAALECRISYSLWSKIESGHKNDPRLSTLIKIACRVQKSLDWLVDYHVDYRAIF